MIKNYKKHSLAKYVKNIILKIVVFGIIKEKNMANMTQTPLKSLHNQFNPKPKEVAPN